MFGTATVNRAVACFGPRSIAVFGEDFTGVT